MPKAEYRSSIRSKKLINSALADLLQEKPVDKITVTDIVTRAGINRGTFYAHYADVPDVINHLIQNTFSMIREVISQNPKQLSQLPGALLGQIQVILESDFAFYKKIMASTAASLMQEQLVSVVVDYLLQHEEEYSLGNHEQYGLTIRFCAGGLSNLYRQWFEGKLDISLSELTAYAQKMVDGIMYLR